MRLVEHQQPGLAREGLGDLHHLLVSDAQPLDRHVGIDVRMDQGQRVARERPRSVALYDTCRARLVAECDVLGDA